MNIINVLFGVTAAVLVAWSSIAVYILLQDRAERRAWQRSEEARRWRQTIDAYRRISEQD